MNDILLKKSKFLEHLINFEIYSSFPILEKDENNVRSSVKESKDNKKTMKKDFYDFIKKKYKNFPELGYFEYEALDNFYDYKFFFEIIKKEFTKKFSLLVFLRNFYIKERDISYHKFEELITKFFFFVDSNFLTSLKDKWNEINLDREFRLKISQDKKYSEFLMYNQKIFLNQLIINFILFDDELREIIKSFIQYHKHIITHIIINIKYNNDIKFLNSARQFNELLNLICKEMETKVPKIRMISIISEIGLIELDRSNSIDLINIIEKNKNLEILILSSVKLYSNFDIIQSVRLNNSLKYIYFDSVFIQDEEICKKKYKENDKVFFIHLNKKLVYLDENNIETESDLPDSLSMSIISYT